jgi:hypothetical protein
MTAIYKSNSALLPALVLLAALHDPGQQTPPEPVFEKVVYAKSPMTPVPLPNTYSETAKVTPEAQAEILGRFVSKMLENAKEPSQEIVDLLNKHFWELI